ncbi:phage major capsid protein [Streptomyces sp. NPDC058471]|uniref:phage major capsid protein n=1 Tax=Streptomyces sp. NPDC058471 TaxID=3346516 RepID=UPI00365AB052
MQKHLCVRDVDFTFAARQEGEERSGSDGENGDGRTLSGYAAVFNAGTTINSYEGRFEETIAPGAFRKTLRERKPIMQWDHGRDTRVGSTPIGVYTSLVEDERGLKVEGRLFSNDMVEPVRQAIQAEAVTGMSFKFQVTRDKWTDNAGVVVRDQELYDLLYDAGERGPLVREVQEVKLYEAGPVSTPAYSQTSVGLRSAEMTDEDRKAFVEECVRTSSAERHSPECNGMAEASAECNMPHLHGASRNTELPSESVVPVVETEERTEPEGAALEGTPEGHTNEEQTARVEEPVAHNNSRKASVPMDVMTIEEREVRRGEIRTRLSEIDNEHSGAELPSEIRSEWDDLNREFEEHCKAIKAASERIARLRELAEDESTHDSTPVASTSSSSRRGAPAFNRERNVSSIYDLGAIRNSARSVDELGGLYRDNAMRAIEVSRFPGVENREDAQERAAHLLDNVDDKQGTLARRMLATGSPVYERAFGKVASQLHENGLSSEERAALAVGAGGTGGYAVPFQLDPTVILTNNGRINPLRSVARQVQIVGKEWQGITSAGVTVTRSAEAAEVGATDPTLAQPTVKAERVTGFVTYSMEVEQDWSQMRSEVTSILADAKEEEESTSFFTGDGIAPNANGILATLSTGSNVSVAATGLFAVGDVYALEQALPPRFRANAVYMANHVIYNKIRQFGVADSHALWERIGNGMPAELLGRPAHEASAMPSTNAALDRFLLYGDFRQFLIVDRIGMNVELVPHILGSNRRPTGQRGLLAVWWNNSKVLVDNAFRVLDGTQ